ncbi:cytochrome P450 [Fennellomyces sp. T-0311]|nr:cytochrome P450 [Fennellomyces sp. T-0311]
MELENFHSFIEHVVARTSIFTLLGQAASENDELVENFKATVADTAKKVRPGSTWLTWLPGVRQWQMWYTGKTSRLVRRHREILFETITPIVQHRLQEMKSNPNWEKPDDIMQDVLEKFEPPPHMDRITYIANWMSTLSFSSIYPTSETATLILYRLAQNPHLIGELLEEQLQVVRDAGFGDDYGNDVFTPEIVERCNLLNSICRESLRLKNESLSVPRIYIGEEDFALSNGTIIHPGQMVLANVFCAHRKTLAGSVEMSDEIAEMKRFNPYRYLQCATPSYRIMEDYLPFGYGRNACPGRAFGMQIVKVLISIILKDYKFAAVEDPSFPIQDRIFLPQGKIIIEKRKRILRT